MKNWKKTLLRESSTLREAIKCLNASGLQIILVINKEKKFIGTITDGDIRRGQLSGLNINQSIKTIINKKAFFVRPKTRNSEINRMMEINYINQLPILNNDHKVVGLKMLKEKDF